MLSGNNGILQKATDAKTETEKGQEREIVAFAYNSALAKKISNGDSTPVTASDLNTELTNQGASADGSNPITVIFTDSKRQYTLNSNGIITYAGLSNEAIQSTTSKTLVQAFKDGDISVGDYINYTPSNTSASITVGKDGIYNNGVKDTTKTGIGTGYDTQQTFTVDTTSTYKTTWRVLGLNKTGTNLMLISGSPIRKTSANDSDPYLVLQGAESYIYCEDTLNAICNIYANTTLADEVRSVKIEDINNALGVAVIEDLNGTPTRVYESINQDLEEGINGYTIDEYDFDAYYQYKEGDFAPENYLGTGIKSVGDTIYRTAYWYGQWSLTNANATAKSLIFDDTETNKSYWLASPGVKADSEEDDSRFGPGFVSYGEVTCGYDFFGSSGEYWAMAQGVRPIISLKPGVLYGENAGELKKITVSAEATWSTNPGDRATTGTFDSTKAIEGGK